MTHALEFYGSADVGRYYKTTLENYQDVHGRISGRADLYDNLSLTASVLYGQRHQLRGVLIDPGDESEATVINRGNLRVGAELVLATVTLSANVDSETRDFVSSGTVDNDDLDSDEHTVTARASFDVDTGDVYLRPT